MNTPVLEVTNLSKNFGGLRALNEGIDAQREDMFRQYAADRQVTQAFRTMADYDQLKRVNLARRSTQSAYVRKQMGGNIREQSNGESAMFCFTSRIGDPIHRAV